MDEAVQKIDVVKQAMLGGEFNATKLMELAKCSYGPILRASKETGLRARFPNGFWLKKRKNQQPSGRADKTKAITEMLNGEHTIKEIAAHVDCAVQTVYNTAARLRRNYKAEPRTKSRGPTGRQGPQQFIANPTLEGEERSAGIAPDPLLARDDRLKRVAAKQLEARWLELRALWGFKL